MNIKQLNEIIEIRKEEILKSGNYSYNFYNELILNWNRLLLYLNTNNLEYNQVNKDNFLKECEKNLVHREYLYTVHAINAIEGLEKINLNANVSRIVQKEKPKLSEYNLDILEKYNKEISYYNSKKTVNDKTRVVTEIMKYFELKEIKDYKDLKASDINDFKNKYLQFKNSNKKRYNYIFKDFLLFLYNNRITTTNFSYLIDTIKVIKDKKIPETWTQEEIKLIVDNMPHDTAVEKRNKAMVLLAIRLGIRFGDIRKLKFNNINWQNNNITFTQSKTSVEITLPLTNEVGNAIIDYIKNGRPKSTSNYIFLTHNDNPKELAYGNTLHKYLIRTYELAGIDYKSNQKNGIHKFRHSLASNMLKNEIPLPIISSSLGHVNENTTRIYLKIDNDKLEECCLEVPNEK